jgi:hypothetical protein
MNECVCYLFAYGSLKEALAPFTTDSAIVSSTGLVAAHDAQFNTNVAHGRRTGIVTQWVLIAGSRTRGRTIVACVPIVR